MSDPVVFIFFSNPQVIRVGLALVSLDQTAISIFWAWIVEVKLGLSFLYGYCLCSGIMYFYFIRMDIMYLTLVMVL